MATVQLSKLTQKYVILQAPNATVAEVPVGRVLGAGRAVPLVAKAKLSKAKQNEAKPGHAKNCKAKQRTAKQSIVKQR